MDVDVYVEITLDAIFEDRRLHHILIASIAIFVYKVVEAAS